MKSSGVLSQSGLALMLSILLWWVAASPHLTEASGLRQAEVLAGLTAGIIGCTTHPCLGECALRVREELKGKLVNDGYFDYSDLATSFPEVRGHLQGVVEWNLEGTLDDVSLIVVDFQADPEVLRLEMERALPGCVFEDDSEEEGEDAAEPAEAQDNTTDWGCSVQVEGGDELDIILHVAPELVFLEIES